MSDKLNSVRTKVPDLEKYSKDTQVRLIRKMGEAHKEAVKDSVNILKGVLDSLKVNASGKLSDSIATRTVGTVGNLERLETVLFFDNIDYVEHANYGREAGRMPGSYENGKFRPDYSRLLEWARAKNGRGGKIVLKDIAKIYWHIAKHGTEGKYFIQAARKPIRDNAYNIYRRKLREFKNGY